MTEPEILAGAEPFYAENGAIGVPPANAGYIFGKLPNPEKRLVWLENSYHVATLDNDKDLILQQSITFIREHS